MKRKFASLVLAMSMVFSSNIYALDNNQNLNDETEKEKQEEVMERASSTPISSHGGHGEYGWGFSNAWAKYAHNDNSHRVVLQTDNTYTYGAWEDAGGNNYSYAEHKKGSSNYAYGEIR